MSHNTAKADHNRWKAGKSPTLSREECIEAHCYECNGGENVYCGGKTSCILFQYSQYNPKNR